MQRDVCHVNSIEIERMCKMHLTLNKIEHSEALFTQYIQ